MSSEIVSYKWDKTSHCQILSTTNNKRLQSLIIFKLLFILFFYHFIRLNLSYFLRFCFRNVNLVIFHIKMSKEIQKHIQHFFQVEELLGSGAYGHVWKVVQKSTKKTYALKKVFDAFQNNIDAQRTYREITILHQLDNPHIIKLKSVIKAKNDKDLYLLFEHMETDLHSLVGENILEMPHLLYIIYQIFKALKYLHSAQLVHRDLKPSNVLINSECEIKLCDFGLVRSLTHQQSQQLILSEDVATRWYRSPEMLLGSEEYDWATDVWSIGCILAELIIGEPLLMGGSNIEQLQKILELTGIPKSEDIQSIKSKVGEGLINQFKIIKKPFKHYFKGSKFETETELISLIKSMLEFNPTKRITVNEVLNHPLFTDLRCAKEEVTCKKFIVPELDDNVRLTVEEYRKAIYKDVQRRYPEYNLEPEEQKSSSSIFRFKRGHNSLLNRTASIDSFPRAKACNSLMRQSYKKQALKKATQTQTPQNPHHSLHCNTVHNSNFYKTAVCDTNTNLQSHNSLYYRKNPLKSLINNQKQENKESTDVSTLIEKSPYRRYKKSNEKINPLQEMEKIIGLTKSKQISAQKENNYEKKQNFMSYLPSTKSKLLHNSSKTGISSPKFDPAQVYNTSPPKVLKKREKNLYRVAEVSNQNKITKKTFTRARKEMIGQLASESKNGSIHNFSGTKAMVGEG